MKSVIIAITILLPAFCFAQAPFTIKGFGPGFKDGDKVYLVYREGEKLKFDSVNVVIGTFKFTGKTTGPYLATLYQNEDPMQIEISHNTVSFYIEPGNIIINRPDSLELTTVSGTPTNRDLTERNRLTSTIDQKLRTLNSNFSGLTTEQQADITNVAQFRQKREQLWQTLEPIKFNFIRTYPASYISLVTVEELKRSDASAQKLAAAYNLLAPELKNRQKGKKLGEDIQQALKSTIGLAATNFSQPDTKGKMVSLSDYKGKYVLVDFWASWCLPCRAENPLIVDAYNKYKGKGFTILGVSLDSRNTRKAWLKAIKDGGLTWTQVSDLTGWKNQAAVLYGITSIPSNLLIDPAGKIIARDIKDKVLENKLAELLGK